MRDPTQAGTPAAWLKQMRLRMLATETGADGRPPSRTPGRLASRIASKAAAWGRAFVQGSLSATLPAVALAIAFPLACLLGYFGYAQINHERSRAQQEALDQARRLAARLEAHLATRLDGLAATAEAVAASSGSVTAIETHVAPLRHRFSDVAQVLVADQFGTLLATLPQSGNRPERVFGDQEWFRRAATSTRPFVGEPRRAGADAVVGLYAPARARDGRLRAVIAADLALRPAQKLLDDERSGAGALVEVITSEGAVAARHPVLPLMKDVRSVEPYRDLVARREGVGELLLEDGERRLVGVVPLRSVGWMLVVGRPSARALGDTTRRFAWVAGAAAAAVLLGFALVLALAQRTATALDRLRAAMSRLVTGEIPGNLPVTAGGEVGALTETFNGVLKWLRDKPQDPETLGQVEEAVEAVVAGRATEAVLRDLLRRVVTAMRAHAGVMLTQERDGLVPMAATGLWDVRLEGIAVPRGQGIAGAVARNRETIILEHVEPDHPVEEPYIHAAGLRSVIAVPMLSVDGVIGVVEVGYRVPHRFSAGEVQQLEAMVHRMAQALEYARALQPVPDFDARVAILKKKAARDGVSLPDDVAFFVASKVTLSSRELESVLGRLHAFCKLTGRTLSLDLVHDVTARLWRPGQLSGRDMRSVEARPGAAEGRKTAANQIDGRAQDGRPLDQPELLVIVRRGATERFRLFQATFAGEPVRVMWDLRTSERRRQKRSVATERRRRDRRGQPPSSWAALDFVIVGEPSAPRSR